MMNVLLVNPYYNGRSEIPPLGLECLASPLIAEGIEASILDLDICGPEEGLESLAACVKKDAPGVVGVTAMSHSFASAQAVCRTVKEMNPETLTVMGGIHATVLFDSILTNHPEVDAVVRGEGEATFLELVRCFSHRQAFSGVDGVSHRDGDRIIHNPDRALQKNLDDFPLPAHHLVQNEKYKTRSISSSRGCHHNCTFCSIQAQYHRHVRTRHVTSLSQEIQNLINAGARRIMFTDDNFTFSLKRIRDLCEAITRRRLHHAVDFYAEGRIDDICRNPLMTSALSEAGFRALYIGAESGSPEILDYYKKGITPEDLIQGVSHCIEQNLTPVVNFILFGPKDTMETIRETIRLARQIFEMGAEIVYAEALVPYPGTPIQEMLDQDGKFRDERGVYYFESYHGIDMDWILRLCNIARAITALIHSEERYLATKKAYLELGYLDELLSGAVPAQFQELYEAYAAMGQGTMPAEVEEIHRYMMASINPS